MASSYYYVEKELDEYRPLQIGKHTFIECCFWGTAIFGYDSPDYWHLDSLRLCTWNEETRELGEVTVKSGPLFDLLEASFKAQSADIYALVRDDWEKQSERIRLEAAE